MKYKTLNISRFLSIVALFVAISACEEIEKGPQFKDSTAPNPLISPVVENTPGGALISYSLPDDTDLLYVVAEYILTNGQKVESKSSVFLPYIEINGYGDTNQHEVKLYTVDRSENRSEPVSITIQPLLPFVKSVKESISMTPDFGGVLFQWSNPGNAALSFIIMAQDSAGKLSVIETVYSGVTSGSYALRGFDPVERDFAIVVRDHWKNYSDTLKNRLTPLFEQMLDPKKFSNYSLPGDAGMSAWEGRFEYLYDGNKATFAHSAAGTGWPQYFTLNLGVKSKLSRIVVVQRPTTSAQEFFYTHGNPRLFEVWGCSETPDPSGSFDNWVKLRDCVAVQPTQQGGTADEDAQHAIDGDEFSFTINDPAVHYIRILVNETWGNTGFIHIGELYLFGQIVE